MNRFCLSPFFKDPRVLIARIQQIVSGLRLIVICAERQIKAISIQKFIKRVTMFNKFKIGLIGKNMGLGVQEQCSG